MRVFGGALLLAPRRDTGRAGATGTVLGRPDGRRLYAENRSFDTLYGAFPGANGLAHVSARAATQVDRDGRPLAELPPIWGGLTARGVTSNR